jgi:CubicO group peptidase (beta-lactamase class C family)
VAVFQLAERGQIRLGDRLTKYFPQFPKGQDVTIRHLLSHTSGIVDYARPGEPLERMGATSDQLVRIIEQQTPLYLFETGTKFAYSNSNYALLGKIIEQISGMSYGQYMAEQVFAKLDMRNTAVDRNSDVVPGRASGYMPIRGTPGGFANGIYVDMSTVYAAGAVRSTARDLANGFVGLFGGSVISAASLREMTTPGRVNDGRLAGDVVHGREDRPGAFGYYGLGLDSYTVCGHRSIGHGGAFPSFSSIARNYMDDGVMLVVVANTGRAAHELESKVSGRLLNLNCRPARAP